MRLKGGGKRVLDTVVTATLKLREEGQTPLRSTQHRSEHG